MATTAILLPGKFHGQRSLASYSPWGTKSQTQRSTTAHMGLRLLTNGPQNWEIILDFPGGHNTILQEFLKVEGKDRRESRGGGSDRRQAQHTVTDFDDEGVGQGTQGCGQSSLEKLEKSSKEAVPGASKRNAALPVSCIQPSEPCVGLLAYRTAR